MEWSPPNWRKALIFRACGLRGALLHSQHANLTHRSSSSEGSEAELTCSEGALSLPLSVVFVRTVSVPYTTSIEASLKNRELMVVFVETISVGARR